MLFPLFLRLAGKRVLVVGAGNVATKKIADLVEAGADVIVVAPADGNAIPGVTRVERAFVESDVDGAWLVFAATNDPAVQAAVTAAAEARHLFSIAIDDPPNGSAYSASVIRRAPITVAISTSGEAPALARLLREVLEQALPDATWVADARALRERWRADGTPMTSRFEELVRASQATRGMKLSDFPGPERR